MKDFLSTFQEKLVLSLFPDGAQITQACYFQRDYLPSPMRVLVSLPNGEHRDVVLRMSRKLLGVERETRLLPILSRLGLPVPTVLSASRSDPNDTDAGCITVLSFLPGENLQTWSCESSAGLEMAIGMVIEAVTRLHQLTEPLCQEKISDWLPRKNLASELQDVIRGADLWIENAVYSEAVEKLKPVLDSIQTPLVFSNGDFQTGQFSLERKRVNRLC